MLLTREEILAGIVSERRRFASLVEGIDPAAMATPSRCAGWSVADVIGHVVGLFSDVAAGRFRGQGHPDVTARQAAERRHLPARELAADLRTAGEATDHLLRQFPASAWLGRAPGGFPGPLRRAVLVLWYELYVHGDDIRCALRLPPDRGPGLRASVHHVADVLQSWGWGPRTLRLDGLEEIDIRGGGELVTGDPLDFLRIGTGRLDPAVLGLDETANIYR
jgi:uncharacterized protein (TIGR03083 family)